MALCRECGSSYDAADNTEMCVSGNEPDDYHLPDDSRCYEVAPAWIAAYNSGFFMWTCSLEPGHHGPHRAHEDQDVTNKWFAEWEDLPDLASLDAEALERWLSDA